MRTLLRENRSAVYEPDQAIREHRDQMRVNMRLSASLRLLAPSRVEVLQVEIEDVTACGDVELLDRFTWETVHGSVTETPFVWIEGLEHRVIAAPAALDVGIAAPLPIVVVIEGNAY
jgi:hypothetical protein